jgi:C4-dicarboxylate-specific signal transduction histidine kinase
MLEKNIATNGSPPQSPTRAPALDRFIFRHYARSALIPILTIELSLLLIYFGVNAYTTRQTETTLRGEVTSIMPHLVKRHADLINQGFERVAEETGYFGKVHEDLFNHPDYFRIAGEEPRFAVAPTGALYQVNRDSSTSLYYTHAEKLSPAQKEKARLTAALDPLYRHMVRDIPNVAASYFNTPDNMNRIYPFIPDVYKQYPADLTMADYNFYYLADAKHNPTKKPAWTGVYLDPAGQGWMLSCVAPVYHKDTLAGVVGLDVTISNIVKRVLSQELPWGATAFLADGNGMILAMSPQAEKILGLTELKEHVYSKTIAKEQLKPEEFNLLQSHNSQIASTFKDFYKSKNSVLQINQEGQSDLFVIGENIEATGWKLFVLIESKQVLQSVNAVAEFSHRIGLLLIAFMLLFYVFFFFFLRKRAIVMTATIAKPVADIALATQTLGSGATQQQIPPSGIAELDDLSQNFMQMSTTLDERSRALVESEVRASVQKKESELAFARGMFESASGYLHNVGNSITRLDSSLHDLNAIVKGTEQYPTVFKKLAEGSDPVMLERFREVLVDKAVPKMRHTVHEIQQIKETIQQTIKHQQQSFKNAREVMNADKFDFVALVREATASIKIPEEKCSLTLDLPASLVISHHQNQLHNGIVNILKNAVESCQHREDGKVGITLTATPNGAVLTVTDNGTGILPEHQPRLLSAGFTTKPEGNGLGLHSFAVFLSANNGSISLKSPGANLGATVTIEVNHV